MANLQAHVICASCGPANRQPMWGLHDLLLVSFPLSRARVMPAVRLLRAAQLPHYSLAMFCLAYILHDNFLFETLISCNNLYVYFFVTYIHNFYSLIYMHKFLR
jgi:hypothetical protein